MQPLHGYHGTACFADVGKIDHCTGLAGIVVFRTHGYLRKEGQRAFATYHEVGDNLERIVEADKRKQVEACDILDGVFVADALQ